MTETRNVVLHVCNLLLLLLVALHLKREKREGKEKLDQGTGSSEMIQESATSTCLVLLQLGAGLDVLVVVTAVVVELERVGGGVACKCEGDRAWRSPPQKKNDSASSPTQTRGGRAEAAYLAVLQVHNVGADAVHKVLRVRDQDQNGRVVLELLLEPHAGLEVLRRAEGWAGRKNKGG